MPMQADTPLATMRARMPVINPVIPMVRLLVRIVMALMTPDTPMVMNPAIQMENILPLSMYRTL